MKAEMLMGSKLVGVFNVEANLRIVIVDVNIWCTHFPT